MQTGTLRGGLAALAALLLLAGCARPAPAPAPADAPRALRFRRLVDGTGRVIDDAVVVVRGERIAAVGSGDGAVPRGAEVVDLRRYTAIPGLIDVHTHMTYWWDRAPGTTPWGQQGQRRSAVTVYLAQENARRTLETGVTTVRDLGASDYGDVAMRDLIARGAMVGPRMAGFGLQRARAAAPAGASSPVPRGRVTDTAEIALAVQAQVDADADVIKVYGSTGSAADTSGNTRELAWFVEAGMTPAQALATATTNAARLLGRERELGAVAPGYHADVVAVEGDPLADVGAVIRGVRWVMKGGAVVVDRR